MPQGLKQELCGNLEGWDGEGGGRKFQEGGNMGVPMDDSCDVWQKMAKFCKGIILKLKNKLKNNELAYLNKFSLHTQIWDL